MYIDREMVKDKKRFENMKNYDNDDYYSSYNRNIHSNNNNFNKEREKSINYYNLLVSGKLLLNITVFIVFIIIV